MRKIAHRFALGQAVEFTATTSKAYAEDGRTMWPSYPLGRVQRGIVVQKRVLFQYENGTETEHDSVLGYATRTYTTTRPIPGTGRVAWLVAYGLHNKPVLVMDEYIQEVNSEEDSGSV